MEPQRSISHRLPRSLIGRLEADAREQSEKTGYIVTRADVLRSIVTKHYEEKEKAACATPPPQTTK